MVFPASQVFNGGQMTDLPEFGDSFDAFDGTELLEIVAPGNVEQGVNYSITTAILATLLNALTFRTTIVTEGATLANPYVVDPTQTRILVEKTVASNSYFNIGGGADRQLPVMVRDGKGDADSHPISVAFTGLCDGLASPIIINNPYSGWVFNPLSNGNWFLTNT